MGCCDRSGGMSGVKKNFFKLIEGGIYVESWEGFE